MVDAAPTVKHPRSADCRSLAVLRRQCSADRFAAVFHVEHGEGEARTGQRSAIVFHVEQRTPGRNTDATGEPCGTRLLGNKDGPRDRFDFDRSEPQT